MAVAVAQPLNVYHDDKHKEKLLQALNSERFHEENLCDATLQVNDKTFSIHKCIVGKFSAFFRKLFKVEMKEKYDSFANMKGLNSETMKIVLDYIYTGSIKIDDENAFEIFLTAEYLLIDELKDICGDYLMKMINTDNWLMCHKFGVAHKWVLLKRKAEEIFIKNFAEVICKAEFLSLENEDVKYFLSRIEQDSSSLRVMTVYKGILSWVKHDAGQREKLLPEMLKLVRFHLLSIETLENILKDDLVKEISKVVDVLNEEIVWKQHLKVEANRNQILFAVIENKCVSLFETLNQTWKKLPDLPNAATGACTLVYHNHLYLIGGVVDKRLIQRLNLTDNEAVWEKAGKTLQDRNRACAIVDGDGIVISGGEFDQSVEIYRKVCVEVQQEQLQPMNHSRYDHAMVKCSGSIYCFGGYNKPLTERYSHLTWHVVNKERKFSGCRAIVINNEIFVFGSNGTLASWNVNMDAWRNRAMCPIAYNLEVAASYRNEIIYIFGRNYVCRSCYSYVLTEYDVILDTWKSVYEVKCPSSTHIFASV